MTDFHIHALNRFNYIQLQAVGYIIEIYIANCAVSEEYIMKHVKEIYKCPNRNIYTSADGYRHIVATSITSCNLYQSY